MLQNNADDAGADSFVVLYDKRYHPIDNLLVYHVSMDDEDMRRDLQGPALLVQNNNVMKDKDIQAIREVSQPSKKGDHSARLQLCVSYQRYTVFPHRGFAVYFRPITEVFAFK
jgi:hypothetical protein